MALVRFDDSRKPLYVLVWPGRFDQRELEQFVQDMVTMVARGERIAVINNLLPIEHSPTPQQRKLISNAVEENREIFRRNVVAWADVVASPLIRGALTALLWFLPVVYPRKNFARVEDAESWCVQLLAREDLRPGRDRGAAALMGAPRP